MLDLLWFSFLFLPFLLLPSPSSAPPLSFPPPPSPSPHSADELPSQVSLRRGGANAELLKLDKRRKTHRKNCRVFSCLSVCLCSSVCPSVCLSVCLSVCWYSLCVREHVPDIPTRAPHTLPPSHTDIVDFTGINATTATST